MVYLQVIADIQMLVFFSVIWFPFIRNTMMILRTIMLVFLLNSNNLVTTVYK